MVDTLSSAPSRDLPPEPRPPAMQPLELSRWAWRQLTSMRTALVLLFLLALAAVPGSLVPQRSVDAARAAQFAEQHPTLAPWYDRLSLFSVYSSPWFAATYLLLFVSLVGCVLPRSRQHLSGGTGTAAARAAAPRPAAVPRVHDGGRQCGRRAGARSGRVARPPVPGRRRRRLGGRREGLPARDRQPGLPPGAAAPARRRGDRAPDRLQGQRPGRRGRGVLQHRLGVRHLDPGAARRRGLAGAVHGRVEEADGPLPAGRDAGAGPHATSRPTSATRPTRTRRSRPTTCG